jgi:uncharacterized membrane protein
LVDTDLLVRDYLGRLAVAAAGLPVDRRAELAAEVREHIDAALAEAGRSDEVTVRNVLERLGTPGEIVAAEAGQVGTLRGAAPTSTGGAVANGSRWGAVEVTSILLIGLAWPALLLPFGLFLWLACGVVGLVLVWASGVWTRRRKLLTTAVVVALYALLFLATQPAYMRCTSGGQDVPCSPNGPPPIVTNG